MSNIIKYLEHSKREKEKENSRETACKMDLCYPVLVNCGLYAFTRTACETTMYHYFFILEYFRINIRTAK